MTQKLVSGGPPLRALQQLLKVAAGGGLLIWGGYKSMFTIDGGHRAVMFDRINGVLPQLYGEGLHFRIPWLQWPTTFDVRTRPKQLSSPTGTRDLQTVNISLRVLYRPMVDKIPVIFSTLGVDYDSRILPSIVNEVLKSVIAQYNASQLITQREQVSKLIKRNLSEEASRFHIVIDDVSITHLSFMPEYAKAVEDKQVAQQDAARARFVVDKALQEKRSTIVKAEGEAKSALLVGQAIRKNPGFLELRRLEAAREIAHTISNSANRVYLDSDTLLMNVNDAFDFNLAKEKLESPKTE